MSAQGEDPVARGEVSQREAWHRIIRPNRGPVSLSDSRMSTGRSISGTSGGLTSGRASRTCLRLNRRVMRRSSTCSCEPRREGGGGDGCRSRGVRRAGCAAAAIRDSEAQAGRPGARRAPCRGLSALAEKRLRGERIVRRVGAWFVRPIRAGFVDRARSLLRWDAVRCGLHEGVNEVGRCDMRAPGQASSSRRTCAPTAGSR